MPASRSSRRMVGNARVRKRTAKNRRRFRLRRLLWPLIVFSAACGIGAGCYYLLTTPKLRMEKVVARGTRLVSRAHVEADAWAVIEGSRGILTRHRNILFPPKRRIIERILRRPEVRTVSLGRILPDTIVVRVEERRPAAAVTNGRETWLADREGRLFHRVRSPVPSAPTIALLPEDAMPVPGKAARARLAQALNIVEHCRKARLNVDKISIDRVGNLCLNIGSDFYVKLGQPVEIPEKLAKLVEILSAKPEIGKEALYIDVSCIERPVLKPKSAGGEGRT